MGRYDQDMRGTGCLINTRDPINDGDSANKRYVDSVYTQAKSIFKDLPENNYANPNQYTVKPSDNQATFVVDSTDHPEFEIVFQADLDLSQFTIINNGTGVVNLTAPKNGNLLNEEIGAVKTAKMQNQYGAVSVISRGQDLYVFGRIN